MCTIVSSVHLSKAEQCLLNSPLPGCTFFNPVASDGKISIGIVSLPCITCQADLATHGGALISKHNRVSVNAKTKEVNKIKKRTLRRSHSKHNCCLNILMIRALDCLDERSRMDWFA